MRRLLAGLGLAWLAACGPSADQEAETGGEAPEQSASTARPLNTHLLVTGEWLVDRLEEPEVVVLHADGDPAAYRSGHIPGAHFLPMSAIMQERNGVPNEIRPVAQLDSVFESVGVSDGSRIVVYGAPLQAARVFFTLDYLGHGDRTSLLDGGLEGWQSEGRPLSADAPAVTRGSFTPNPRPEIIVNADWVNARLGDPEYALLDARPLAQFSGQEHGEGVPRPGHIPGADHLFWEEMLATMSPPRLHDREALRSRFDEVGVDPGMTVVTYCRTGMQASFAYFVARYLGYDAKMYDASFADWSNRPALPVER